VHALAILPAKIALANALRDIKANSSKWIHESKAHLRRFGWQDGYSAFTVSQSQLASVRHYIQHQKRAPPPIRFQNGADWLA